MSRKAQNSNKQFLMGTAALAFAVLAIVFIFVSLSMEKLKEQEAAKTSRNICRIRLSEGIVGDSATVYLNDSLLWDGYVAADTTLSAPRTSEENTLMVSRTHNDAVSFFPLDATKNLFILRRENEEIRLDAGRQ